MGNKRHPLPVVRSAMVILGSHDPDLNHVAMLPDYLTAITAGTGPMSLCGLDGPKEVECTSKARCQVCWSRIPQHAICVARLTYQATTGSVIDLAPARIHRVSSSGLSTWVYAVHAVRAHEITATELVCSSQDGARDYAVTLSTDPGVLAAVITRHTLDTLGERQSVAMFVNAEQQQTPTSVTTGDCKPMDDANRNPYPRTAGRPPSAPGGADESSATPDTRS